MKWRGLAALAVAMPLYATTPWMGDAPASAVRASSSSPDALRGLFAQLRTVCADGLIFEPVRLADDLPFALRITVDEDAAVRRPEKAAPPLGMNAVYIGNFWKARPSLTLNWVSVAPVRILREDVREGLGTPDRVDESGGPGSVGGRVEIYESICKDNSALSVKYWRGADHVGEISITSR